MQRMRWRAAAAVAAHGSGGAAEHRLAHIPV